MRTSPEREDGPLDQGSRLARQAWAGVNVPETELADYLARRAAGGAQTEGGVRDLYLACACVRGDPKALQIFDHQFLGPLAAILQRGGAPGHVAADVVQTLRTKLLLGPPPGIAEYSGRTDLIRWLRVAAARELSKVYRHERSISQLDPDEPLPGLTPEEESIRARYAGAFNEAFREAFRHLPSEDRLTLRLHFAQGLNLDRLASALGFSRATAGRRVLQARGHLRDEVLRRLSLQLDLAPDEAVRVLAALRSRLEISMGALITTVGGRAA
jgi:RNA polymerase sigma-70 factor